MITSALLRTEAERWREEYNASRPAGLVGGFLGRLGMTASPPVGGVILTKITLDECDMPREVTNLYGARFGFRR
jgi:hypothetical protein